MNFILTFIINQVSSRVSHWQTTIPAAFLASVTAFVANSGLIDPNDVNSLAGQICQFLIYGLSLILLAWKDRKQPPEDNTPVPGPGADK